MPEVMGIVQAGNTFLNSADLTAGSASVAPTRKCAASEDTPSSLAAVHCKLEALASLSIYSHYREKRKLAIGRIGHPI